MKDCADFSKHSIDEYDLEVIAGNHRCVALQQLLEEYTHNKKFKVVSAILFTGIFYLYFFYQRSSYINHQI